MKRNKGKHYHYHFHAYTIVSILLIIFSAYYYNKGNNSLIPSQPNVQQQKNKPNNTNTGAYVSDDSYGGITKTQYQQLANMNFKSGDSPVIEVNNNHSTLNPQSWSINKVIYQNLDDLNRTSGSNTGFLEQRNVANDSLRVRQNVQPTGWHYNRRNGVQIYNRGHLIAYSLSKGIGMSGNYNPAEQSGDQNNPKNLFTQTAFSNQDVQTMYEAKVRKALRSGDKVIYQATPIFQGNDLMAKGINLQAISTNGILDFNVYIFNVQPNFNFNYATGQATIDHNMKINWQYSYKNF